MKTIQLVVCLYSHFGWFSFSCLASFNSLATLKHRLKQFCLSSLNFRGLGKFLYRFLTELLLYVAVVTPKQCQRNELWILSLSSVPDRRCRTLLCWVYLLMRSWWDSISPVCWSPKDPQVSIPLFLVETRRNWHYFLSNSTKAKVVLLEAKYKSWSKRIVWIQAGWECQNFWKECAKRL